MNSDNYWNRIGNKLDIAMREYNNIKTSCGYQLRIGTRITPYFSNGYTNKTEYELVQIDFSYIEAMLKFLSGQQISPQEYILINNDMNNQALQIGTSWGLELVVDEILNMITYYRGQCNYSQTTKRRPKKNTLVNY